ncbi:MAG TPA: hypothetical protein VHC95_08770 [Opitutales bacterium]|nr:hypothetical protein [Opitutales bacterium]
MPTPLHYPCRKLAVFGLFFTLLIAPAFTHAADDKVVSLAGQWRFQMDPDDTGWDSTAPDADSRNSGALYNKDLTGKIQLPGILQAQGYGDDITLTTPWVAALGVRGWQNNPELARFTEPGDIKIPWMAQPVKHYLGVAWYQRDIDIPASWAGQRVELFLERAHWRTIAWVDGKRYPYEESLVAPHVTDLGILTPGKHRLTIRVDNRTLYRQRVDGHSVSDQLGGTWNGIAGNIELRATSPVWIDDAQVFPSVEKKSADIHVTIANDSGKAGSGMLSANGVSVPVKWDAKGGAAQITVPLGANAQTWDEFHPVLQHLTLTLKGDYADDAKPVTFGLREISFNDKALFFNGHPLNIRATHFADEFPLTGAPATDVDAWKKIIALCKSYGLNGMRFHSSTPPDAAFTAADELGFYIQAEGPFWDGFSPGSEIARRLDEETALMRKYYGNHPSFIMMSASNESGGAYGPIWAKTNYEADPRRLYATSTGNDNNLNVSGGATYASMPHTSNVTGGGGLLRSNSGGPAWAGGDYGESLRNVHIPILAHEIGQLCAYPDFDQIKEFTGYLRPGNLEIFRASAQAHGVLDRNHEFAWASGRFQTETYKLELETNLRTPGLDGFQMLDLHDYLGQGTALVGVVDALWHPKSYVTGAEFARFAGPIVPLARLGKRLFDSTETLDSDVELYNFGEGPLQNTTPYWRLVGLDGKVVAQGEWPARDFPIGKNLPLGHVSVPLANIPAPAEYRLVVGLKGTKAENDWHLWVYPPARPADPQAAGVFETNSWSAAQDYLAKGGKVLYMPPANDLVNSPPLDSVPIFWNRQMNPRESAMEGLWIDAAHPALAEFPTEAYCDLEWNDLVRNVRAINIEGAPAALKPIVSAVDDYNRNWKLAVLFEARVGPGRLLVSAIDLLNNRNPGAPQLQRSLLDYMGGAKFQPALAMTRAQADQMWSGMPADVAAPIGAPPPEIDEGPRQGGP